MTDPIDPQLENLLRDGARRRFGPGFADRVMQRVEEEEGGLVLVMPSQFLRLAAGVAATAVLLAGYSLFLASPYEDQSTIEAVLGLEPETTTSVYTLDPIEMLQEGAR